MHRWMGGGREGRLLRENRWRVWKYEKRSRVVGRGSVKCTANKVLALKKLELLLVRLRLTSH